MFFRSGHHHIRPESTPVIYHQSESIQLEPEAGIPLPPRLLFILNRLPSFELFDGMILQYEDSNYGSVIMDEAGNADFVHISIQQPRGNSYQIVGEIPESLPIYAYVSGNRLSFHTELIATHSHKAKDLWWMGKGLYLLHQDQIWRHEACRLKRVYQDSIYLISTLEASDLAETVFDVKSHIRRSLKAIELPIQHQYSNLSVDQCQQLETIAEQWWLHWAWSERQLRRRFQRSICYCTFSWSYPDARN